VWCVRTCVYCKILVARIEQMETYMMCNNMKLRVHRHVHS